MADLFRQPKPSFWFFESQTEKTPFLKTAPPTGEQLVVFTNCDEAVLLLNGKLLSREKPTFGKSTSYAECRPFDGSNTENLEHPPVVFDHVPFGHPVSGKFEVVGYRNGHAVARDSLPIPGQDQRLKVWIDDLGLPLKSGVGDVVFVRAAFVDSRGSIVTSRRGKIHFQVTGAGSLAGEAEVPTEMGIASNLIRGGAKAGAITIEAGSANRQTGRLVMHSVK